MTTTRDQSGLAAMIYAYWEKRRLRRSYSVPFIAGAGRDTFRFYENGRWTEMNVEMMAGDQPRRIYPAKLKWSDTGEALGEPKQAAVISELCVYLDRQKIRWEICRAKAQG